jgi:alginate O-acetyltransferase complex protein AlgI
VQFLSFEFLAALALVFTLYWAFPRRGWQNLVLLGASLGLVLYFGIPALSALMGSTLLEWGIALKMGATASRRGRSWLLWLSIALNAAQLAFFKYSHFFLPEVSYLLSAIGFKTGTLRLLMPVGLSFWTLQKMTLTLDVFYGRKSAEKNFFNCLLFTGFFPTIFSGPIEHSRDLLPQFAKARAWDTGRFSEGVWLFAIGAFQKAVIADNVAVAADALLRPGNAGVSIMLGMWAYALQIYADFAGYSYMARGCARFLGINITQNFLAPYLARNLSDYWKNWHISLSGWLNEYIFSPVSMDLRRWGTAGIVAAIWVTFIMSGIWHGTGWTFFAYGCFHALGLTVFTLSKKARKRVKSWSGDSGWLGWLAVLFTFNWVCLGYVFFRAPDMATAAGQIGSLFRGTWNPLKVACDWSVLAFSALAVFGLQGQVMRDRDVFWIFGRTVWFRVALYLALGFLLLRFYAPSDRFIYTQF